MLYTKLKEVIRASTIALLSYTIITIIGKTKVSSLCVFLSNVLSE